MNGEGGGKINRRRCTRWPINCAAQPRGYQDCYVSHSCGKLDRWKYLKARQIRVANGHVRERVRPPTLSRNCSENNGRARSWPLSSVLGKYNKYNVASRRWTHPRAVVRLLPYLARVFKEERKTVTFPLIIDITCRETRRDVSQRESPCPEWKDASRNYYGIARAELCRFPR